MPQTLAVEEVTVEDIRNELLTIAKERLDEIMLRICLLGDKLTSDERHPIRNDLAVVYGIIGTLSRPEFSRS